MVVRSSVTAMVAMLAAGASPPAMAQDDISRDRAPAAEDIIVTGSRQTPGNKTEVSLLETPQNIQILSAKLLRDQGANLLENALQNVAGVMTGSYARSYDFFRIRGFDASSYTYVDGLPRGVAINVELAGLEQVEVIKGPSSVLFGQGSPGGLVNLVSKRPTRDAHVEVTGSYGSYTSYSTMVDVSGPLNQGGNLYGRIVTNYRNDRSFIDFHPATRRLYVAPSLTWDIGPSTKLTFLASLSRDWSELIPDQPAAGLVYAGPLGFYDRSVYIGDPDNKGKIEQTFITAGFEFKHSFSDALSYYNNARYSYLDLAYLNLYQPLAFDPATGLQTQYGNDSFEKRRIYSIDNGFQIDMATGPLRHRATIGMEFQRRELPSRLALGFAPLFTFNVYNPDYSVFIAQPRSYSSAYTESEAFGFYLQDTITLAPKLNLTLGARYDTVKINDADYDKLSPRAGLTYEFLPGASAYLSFARSFLPQPGYYDLAGDPVAPENGEAYEAGIKFAAPGGRMSGTAAIYQITRSNVATPIPNMPGVYAVTGKQRSKGFELDGQFEVMTGLQLIASYAYTHATVVADNAVPAGETVIGVPRHQGSLWARYAVTDGQLKGLSVSLGGSAYSKQQASLPNTYKIPSYALVNGNIAYNSGPFSAQFNINNIFNKKYISGAFGDLFVVGGEPRIWRATFGWRF